MTVYRRQIVPNPDISEKDAFLRLLERYLNENDEVLDSVLNMGLSFTDNFDGVFVTFTSSATPDAENTIAHTLGKAPTGFIVTNINKGAVVYDSGTAWTSANIFLKVNTASTAVTIFIF